MTPSEQDNRVIWTPQEKRGHVESFFLKFNDVKQGISLWVKFTIFSPIGHPEAAVGEVWGIFFDVRDPTQIFACKETYPIQSCSWKDDHVEIRMGSATLTHGHTIGELSDEKGQKIRWDLSFTTDQPTLHHFPFDALYTWPIPKSKAKSPHPDSRFTGTFETHRQTFSVADVPGMQGHNWGREHTYTYAWGHCNAFSDHPDVVFEGLSGRIKIGPWITPFISLGFLRYQGEWIRFDRLTSLHRVPVDMTTSSWKFTFTNRENKLTGHVFAPASHFAGLAYQNPDRFVSHCLNSKIANATLTLTQWGRIVEQFQASSTFALEILVRSKDHGVPILV